jgi:SAM-dependent methyltransferase
MSASPKQHAMALARGIGVLPLFERARYLSAVRRAATGNKAYLAKNPDFAPPPLWWMHDMYAHASFELYMNTGRDTAAGLARRIDAHVKLDRPRVADWGCGLARVIRHLPDRYERRGFDYNPAAIDWCRQNIPGCTFAANSLRPPLPTPPASFDALYALSVFTHLSEKGHQEWFAEIARVLAPGGVFLGAFHAAPSDSQLLAGERARFQAGELVTRGSVAEGSRTFTAFHPEAYLRRALAPHFEIVEGLSLFFGQQLLFARKR